MITNINVDVKDIALVWVSHRIGKARAKEVYVVKGRYGHKTARK